MLFIKYIIMSLNRNNIFLDVFILTKLT